MLEEEDHHEHHPARRTEITCDEKDELAVNAWFFMEETPF
jgi:hypothetical protein